MFLAREAWDVHLIDLENESLTVNGDNVLTFEPSLDRDIHRVQGAGMVAGGLFNTVFTGFGRVAVVFRGSPVLLNVDQPTFVDTQAAVAWSSTLSTSVRSTFKAGAIIGRGSGEAFQLAPQGQGPGRCRAEAVIPRMLRSSIAITSCSCRSPRGPSRSSSRADAPGHTHEGPDPR